ncbi:MAG: MFS transporter [Sporichthyaceae bacterium]
MSFTADLKTVVGHGNFRRLYFPRLASQASDGLFQVALASYIFFTPERQASAGAAAATFATLLLPYTFVGPFAGVLLDRWSRRQVLIWTPIVRASLLCVIAALVLMGNTGPALFACALLALSAGRFYLNAVAASIPNVVARRDLVMANSVCMTSGSLCALAGGGLGLALHRLLQAPTLLMLGTAVGYLVAASLAVRIARNLLGPHLHEPPPPARQAVRAVAVGLVSGAKHVLDRPAARNALAVLAVQRFCYGTGTIATLLLYRNYFHETQEVDAAMTGLGAVFAAAGLGYFVAAIITPQITPIIGPSGWIAIAMGAAAVFGFALAAPYQPPPIVLGAFLLGLAAQSVKICVDSIVQGAIDDEFRGRVFSFYDVLFNSAFVLAAVVASFTMPASGKSYAILAAVSLLYALAGGIYLRSVVWPRRVAHAFEVPAHLVPVRVRADEDSRPRS